MSRPLWGRCRRRHPKRLARFELDSPPAPFGSPDSREELVAELGSASLCAEAASATRLWTTPPSYLAGWLRVLRSDKRVVVLGAGAASKAASLISGSAE